MNKLEMTWVHEVSLFCMPCTYKGALYCTGYKYNLVHVQPHTVPASFMADVSNPENVAYSENNLPYDTTTKLDKEQVCSPACF